MYEQQFNPFGGNLAIVKGYFRSGKILTLGIFYVISIVLSFILTASVSFSTLINSAIDYCTRQGISVPPEVRNAFLSQSASSAIISAAISSIFPLLTAIAFIILFAKSRNTSENSSPIAGATILHVLAVISLIFTIIGAVAGILVYVFVFIVGVSAVNNIASSNSSYSTYSQSLTGGVVAIMVVLGVILLAYVFISIFYAVSCKNFYRSVKRSMTTPELENKGAAPYGVFNIIMAVFSVIYMIAYMVMAPSAAGIIFISSIVTILIHIFTAIMALGYNRYIKNQKVGINSAPYGAAPMNGAPMNAAPAAPYNMPDYAAPQQQNPVYGAPVPPANEQSNPAQPQAMYCPNCGAKTEPGAPFCPNCGTKL